ncbi:MAG: glycosyltransferase [Bacteroidota bacterium]
MVILSGPEPQRTIFENLLLAQLNNFDGKVVFVRGLPGDNIPVLPTSVSKNIIVKNHLAAKELNDLIEQCTMIISRSGYTTVMDLAKLGKKAILVPTPGQTEQEYLADYLSGQKMFFALPQDKFDLKTALQQAAGFPFDIPQFDMNQYKTVIKQFAESL